MFKDSALSKVKRKSRLQYENNVARKSLGPKRPCGFESHPDHNSTQNADMLELVDNPDLGSGAAKA